MKYIAVIALFLLASSNAIKLTDDDEPQTAAQAAGLRDSSMFEDQVDGFMAAAKEQMKSTPEQRKKAALERAKANSLNGKINYISKPDPPVKLSEEDKLPEIQL